MGWGCGIFLHVRIYHYVKSLVVCMCVCITEVGCLGRGGGGVVTLLVMHDVHTYHRVGTFYM